MQLDIGPHPDEEVIEKYAMRALESCKLDSCEDHLLVCARCQERVTEMDEYLRAFRTVAPRLRQAQASDADWRWFLWKQPAFALAASVLLAIPCWLALERRSAQPAPVLLVAHRGAESAQDAHVRPGKSLILKIDLTELQPAASYGVEIVSSVGDPVWSSRAEPVGGALNIVVSEPLARGMYHVRLYSETHELLREFGLAVGL
jgi:hypothetical protein